MKLVSSAYKKSMADLLRERSFVRVSFGNVDVDAARDGTWHSAGQQSWSEVQTLDYSYLYEDTAATLELNRWALDGKTQAPVPADGELNDGFVSSAMSREDGTFPTPPVMTRSFSKTRIFMGLTLTFDTRAQEWPLTVRVDFWNGSSIADSKTVHPENTTVTVETDAGGVNRVDVTFLKMLPFRRPRVENVIYGVGEVFTNDDLISLRQSDDIDPLSRRLPSEQLSFTILDYAHRYDPDNPKGVYKYVEVNAPVSVQYGYELSPGGEIEWLKPDKYLLDGKPAVSSNRATFSATGLIGRLTDSYYKSTLGQKNLYDMAEAVLLDADLTLTELGEHPWVIDESLKNMTTTAVLPISSHMNCLQLIAHAARCRLYSDDDNIVHLEPFGVTVRGIYSGTASDNGHTVWSELFSLDTGESSANTAATLELNRWVLDGGQQVPLDSEIANGYVSSQIAGADGVFSEPPVLVKEFDVPHDLPLVKLRFDDVLGEYPASVQIRYYRYGSLRDTQTVAGIESAEITVQSTRAENITRVEIAFLSGLPYNRARLSKLYFRDTDFKLDFTSILENSQVVTKIDALKAVTVAKYGYTADSGQRGTIFEGVTAETALHVEFSTLAQDVEITVEGGELLSSSIYGRAADLNLSEGTKTVTITGVPLSESSTVIAYPVDTEGETDREENPLITSDRMAAQLAAHVIAYLQMRNTYDANYRGNPELECGDIIGLQTLYTEEMDALVLADVVSFNGSLSGSVKVKGLIDAGSYQPSEDPYIYGTPSQIGALTFNGQEQAPQFQGYDPAKLEIGGTLTATNAGTYEVAFTPRAGYEWEDGEDS